MPPGTLPAVVAMVVTLVVSGLVLAYVGLAYRTGWRVRRTHPR